MPRNISKRSGITARDGGTWMWAVRAGGSSDTSRQGRIWPFGPSMVQGCGWVVGLAVA